MTAMPEEEIGRYGCPVCPCRFESLAEKKAHLRELHPRGEKP